MSSFREAIVFRCIRWCGEVRNSIGFLHLNKSVFIYIHMFIYCACNIQDCKM
ncbi:hypothetical protein ACOSQ3_027769 [Xanthoceras sorbifolium]